MGSRYRNDIKTDSALMLELHRKTWQPKGMMSPTEVEKAEEEEAFYGYLNRSLRNETKLIGSPAE